MGNRLASGVEHDRALGALLGVAIGDALGMPSQTLPRQRIRALYGAIEDFVAPVPSQPISHGLPAASITDDTEQSLLLARHLLERGGDFDERAWANELIAWEQETHARGVNDLLGPSTKRAVEALLRGEPLESVGLLGTTNGAAMRIAPVGVAVGPEPLVALVDAVAATCRLTHNTAEAIGAAAAVAAVVSAGVDGANFDDAIAVALAAARAGERRAPQAPRESIAERIARALELTRGGRGQYDANRIADKIGVSVAATESVPMAFAIARLSGGDAWRAGVLSANIGDDTDTIGAIAAGMCGACSGASALPADKARTVIAVNRLDLDGLTRGLLELRHVRAGATAERAT
jgi:ADP-ribosylglycohydrolase